MKVTKTLPILLCAVMIVTIILTVSFIHIQSNEINDLEIRYQKIWEQRSIFSNLVMQLQGHLLPYSYDDIVSVKKMERTDNVSYYIIIHDSGNWNLLKGYHMSIYNNHVRVESFYPTIRERSNPWWRLND